MKKVDPEHISTGFNTLSPCRYGWMVYHDKDQYIGASLRKYGEYSEGEVELFRLLLRPGDVVVEAGANFGAHTVPMAQMVGPQGRIVAVEPQRLVFQAMVANVALNSLSNVIALQAGLGTEPGWLTIPVQNPGEETNFGGFRLRPGEGETVEIRTVDGLNLRQCRLLKVDVEGMEYEVLKGAEQTIRRFRPILYVENDREENSARLIALIQSMGYRLWWHKPTIYNPRNYRNEPENIFRCIGSINMLCLALGPEVEAGLDLREIQSPQDRWND